MRGIGRWDARSDQPLPLRGGERAAMRYGYGAETIAHLGAVLRGLPGLPWRWLRTSRLGYAASPAPRDLIGFALSARSAPTDTLVQLLGESGVRHALLRVPVWQRRQLEPARDLVRALPEIDWVIALVQDRNSVVQPDRWRSDLQGMIAAFRPQTAWFQIGQAPNRRKWGCAHLGEYLELLRPLPELQAQDPDLHFVGPGILDFDPLAQLRLVHDRRLRIFDAQTLGLYVDRRGSPYGRQLGLDLAGKIRCSAAIAAGGLPRSKRRLWISETNWPLQVPGNWAPAGPDYQVDEETYAQHMVDYLSLCANSGLVERVYWWQPVARGYGLIDDRDGRRRPAWERLCALLHNNRF